MKERPEIVRKLYKNELPIFAVGTLRAGCRKIYPASATLILRTSGSEGMHVCCVPKKAWFLTLPGRLLHHPACVWTKQPLRPCPGLNPGGAI